MNKRPSLDVRDSITLGIFTALALMLNMLLLATLHFLPGTLVLFKEAVVALVTGPVYVLMLIKVPRRGAFTANGLATAVAFMLTGFFTVSLVVAVGGILADVVAATGNFRRPWTNVAAYVVFRVAQAVGTYIPFYLWADSFVGDLAASGKVNQEFLDIFVNNLSSAMGAAILLANVVAACLGGIMGYRMLDRHFRRAGIA